MIEGLDGSGKGRLLNKLILEIDSRAYDIYSTHAGDQSARDYPLLWRMWKHTPVNGKLQFFDRSAYYLALDGWAEGKLEAADLDRYWDDLRNFERQLSDNGTLILKILLTVSKKEQARRFRKYEKNPKNRLARHPKGLAAQQAIQGIPRPGTRHDGRDRPGLCPLERDRDR